MVKAVTLIDTLLSSFTLNITSHILINMKLKKKTKKHILYYSKKTRVCLTLDCFKLSFGFNYDLLSLTKTLWIYRSSNILNKS